MAAITTLTVLLWVTEAIPLAAAALLAPCLAVVMGVTSAADALAPIASPLIFLFMGGFMLALGLSEQGLDRRAALWLLGRRWIAGSPARASAGVGGGDLPRLDVDLQHGDHGDDDPRRARPVPDRSARPHPPRTATASTATPRACCCPCVTPPRSAAPPPPSAPRPTSSPSTCSSARPTSASTSSSG